jgi:hypothetical protein
MICKVETRGHQYSNARNGDLVYSERNSPHRDRITLIIGKTRSKSAEINFYLYRFRYNELILGLNLFRGYLRLVFVVANRD